MGFTPELVVGVWTGNADNSPMVDISGISGAAPIWHDFMEEALKGRPPQAFARPSGLVDVEICADSGMLPSDICPRHRTETFIISSQPTARCNAHRLVPVDRHTGELATPGTPDSEIVQRLAMWLPPEAAGWISQYGNTSGMFYMTDSGSAGSGLMDRPSIALARPEPNAVYRIVAALPLADQCIEVEAVPHALPALERIDLYVDDRILATRTAAPYSALWQLEPGTHVFRAQALDAHSNTWSSDAVEVQVMR